jgi:hypothetical protein
MKIISILAFILLVSQMAIAQIDLQPDVIAESGEPRLTASEIKQEKKSFLYFITKFRSSEFIGHTQYTLSALNLSIRANVKYSVELDGTIMFQMATDGNRYVTNSNVTFPMQGLVYFEVNNSKGPISFETETGETVSFYGKKNMFYIVESEKSFSNRKNVQSKFNRADKPIGRFIAEVRYDLFSQDIEFYEIQESSLLVRRGSFNGNVPPARRTW